MSAVTDLPAWPVSRIEEALYRLGGRDDLAPTFGAIAGTILEARELQPWLYAAASRGGLEAEPLSVRGGTLVVESAPGDGTAVAATLPIGRSV